MKRLLVIAAAVAAACALTPAAHADALGNASPTSADISALPADSMSTLNPLLDRFPALAGPDRRHICLISDQLDRSWCVYVAIP